MASFMNKLRGMVGFKAKEENKQPKVPKTDRIGAFQTLSAQFLACEDDALKAQIWDQMCKALPDTLFLAAMCYEGDDPKAPVRDRDLHATAGAKGLYALNQHIVTHGNPGYRLAKKADNRRIHLCTIIYHKTKEEWVPLFTDFTKLLPVFGQNSRVTIISFAEARKIAGPYQGIVINPGKDAIRLDNGTMKKAL